MDSPPVSRFLTLIVGIVSAFIVGGLLSLMAWLVLVSIEQPGLNKTPAFVFAGVIAAVGGFFAVVAYRLIANRGARAGGGLLSATGWRVMGGIFVTFAVMFVVGTFWFATWNIVAGAVWSATFARWCFLSARSGSPLNE